MYKHFLTIRSIRNLGKQLIPPRVYRQLRIHIHIHLNESKIKSNYIAACNWALTLIAMIKSTDNKSKFTTVISFT